MDTQTKLAIDRILTTIAAKRAADVHLSVGTPPTMRLHNELVPLPDEPIITKDFMETFVEVVLDNEQEKILDEEREIILAYQLNRQTRYRINIFYQRGVLAAYLRLIGNELIPLEKLGLPTAIDQFAQATHGLLIISGSFGSGKTTTAASLIQHFNTTRSAYILTVERPIEYIFSSQRSIIEQREVGRDAVSFERAIRTITQEDVDILVLSELATPQVISAAISIAASGRLVIANVEANTTVKTLEHIINRFPGGEQPRMRERLASNLMGTICQRLIPRVGGSTIPVAELMLNTPPIQAHIKDGSFYQLPTVIQTSRAEGMISLDWSLAELAKTNEITVDTALEYASDEQLVRSMLSIS
ncbi:MAG: Flp pilus assembly complex ATPase component TadA [Candidatus Kerfeldbacteria bacterium]|nr:Flp pilus assembly complex ATPase component TadA [Candidatus Kerfeldbacteria bacterium]